MKQDAPNKGEQAKRQGSRLERLVRLKASGPAFRDRCVLTEHCVSFHDLITYTEFIVSLAIHHRYPLDASKQRPHVDLGPEGIRFVVPLR